MPSCFTVAFGKSITAIIDCFEIFTETPPDKLSQALLWSSYKHHDTAKLFVVITPQGSISYISEAWGGRTSDKYIVENSGFLDHILPGDVILADRGFLIKESLDLLRANLQMPAFTKGIFINLSLIYFYLIRVANPSEQSRYNFKSAFNQTELIKLNY